MSSERFRYWLLIASNYIANFGSVISLVAIPVYVLQKTGSAFEAGLAGAANTIPVALGGIVGGAIVDRFGSRAAGTIAGLAEAIVVAALPFLDRAFSLPLWLLAALLFLRSLLDIPAETSRVSVLAEVSKQADVNVDTANAVFQSAGRVALVVGPPIAGLMISQIGAISTLFLDALALLFAALTLLVATATVPKAPKQPESFVSQIVVGIRIITGHKALMAMVQVFVAMNFIDDAFPALLLPVYARDVLHDPLAVGVPLVAFGIGAMLGTFAFIPIAKIITQKFHILLTSIALIAMFRLALTAEPSAFGLAALSFLIGLAAGPLRAPNKTLSTVESR